MGTFILGFAVLYGRKFRKYPKKGPQRNPTHPLQLYMESCLGFRSLGFRVSSFWRLSLPYGPCAIQAATTKCSERRAVLVASFALLHMDGCPNSFPVAGFKKICHSSHKKPKMAQKS